MIETSLDEYPCMKFQKHFRDASWNMFQDLTCLLHATSLSFSVMICRESLFLLTYLLFLINTVVGLIVAIWRMVITALYNIIHLGRIDVSLLHRTAESYDPGTTVWLAWLKALNAALWQISISCEAAATRHYVLLWNDLVLVPPGDLSLMKRQNHVHHRSDFYSVTFDPIQPTDTTLSFWRWRWASHTRWWRLSVGCCWTWWSRAAELDRKYETQRKVEIHGAPTVAS